MIFHALSKKSIYIDLGHLSYYNYMHNFSLQALFLKKELLKFTGFRK